MTVQLHLGDCLEFMRCLPDGCIDLTVTSPPYDNLRLYKGYSFDFEPIARELYRITKPGGVVVWVVADSVQNGGETLTSMRQALYFVDECGFRMHDTMAYVKDGMPFADTTRYYQVFEYMFVLSNGAPKTHKLLRTRTINVDKSSSTQRLPNGNTRKMQYELGKETRVMGNVWEFGTGYMKTTKDVQAFKHPAMFPELLADRHILTWSNPGDTVFDPFTGAGTTGKMAIRNGRNFIGCEISEEYVAIAERRISDAEKAPPLFVLDTPRAQQLTLEEATHEATR
jgi:site-specific DNA-methyltransferase (adenine-specific)